MIKKYKISSSKRDEMIEITTEVQEFVREAGFSKAAAIVYCPHTTAGITINENADPDVKSDMIRRFDEMYPWNLTQDKHDEGNSAAHMKASAMGASQHLIVHEGRLLLGRWQGVYFCEFDGPREREFYIKIVEG
ncbi:YjbQ family protein [Peribacillus saganii]|uniref:YjbQ family protein n=1 Tax=Peribacillus saganii TaxID=2303992 RepID=A0A372LJ52_9BACI|nr:secondary thiamine-phosphate synthase enzyme YjbQ [Peribacillus saganii]RFU66403.1 YjbQ family protein [Peribacillus saganii]